MILVFGKDDSIILNGFQNVRGDKNLTFGVFYKFSPGVKDRRVAQQHGFHRCHDGGLEPLPVGGADRQGGQPP